jgi:RHS repeat-associated protein
MPDEYPYKKDCFKCGEKVDSVDSNKSCPEGTSENPDAQSLYYTVGLGTTSYNTKNNYVSRDLGLRQKEFSTYNGPRVDQPPFNGSLTSEWGEKLMRPVVIGLVTETITPATFTPASLQLQGENAGNAWVKRDAANALRQILSDQYLTDIIAENNGTSITSYVRSTIGSLNATTGLYSIPTTARKFRTITITRPDQNSLTTCDITTTDYSSSLTSPKVRIRRWVTNASFTNWTLSHFADTTQPNKEYSRLVLEKTDLGNGILQRTRTHSQLTADASLLVTKITREKYRDLGQGNLRIMQETTAPGTPEEFTTTYTYTDATGTGTVGLNGVITAPAASGSPNQLMGYRIASSQSTDGSWTQYQYTYNGATKIMVTDQWTPWKNAAFGDKTNAIRTTIILEESGRTVTQRIGTQIISDLKETLITLPDGTRVIRSSTSTGTTTPPLINETGYYAENAAEPNRGRIRYSRHNDGTLTSYSYSYSYSYTTQGSNIKTTTHNGVINAAQSAANVTGPISGTFTAGTRSETITNAFNREIAQASYDIASNLLLSQWDAITFDDVGRPTKIIHNLDPNDFEETSYNCCGIATRRERDGTTTQFTRDFLGRETFRSSVSGSRTTNTANTYSSETLNGRTLPKVTHSRSVTAAGNTMSQFLGETISNLAGQTIISRSPDANGDGTKEQTTYTHNLAARTTSVTGPDGTTSTSTRYADGQQHTSVTEAAATAVTPLTTYDYTLHNLNGGGIKTTVTQSDDNVVLKSSSSYADQAGRTIKTESPGYNGAILTSTPLYDERGRTIGQTRTGQPAMKYVLNLQGETTEVWTDANGDGEFNDTVVAEIKDTCQKTTTDYVTEDGKVCQRSTQSLRTDANADVITATSYTSTDGLYRKSVPLAGTGPITTTTATRPLGGNSSQETRTYLGSNLTSASLVSAVSRVLNANGTATTTQTNKDTTGATIITASSTSDLLDRTVTQVGERGLTSSYGNFTAAGQTLLTTHSDDTQTRITLDAAARPTKVETLDSTGAVKATRHSSYHPTGQVAAQWGDLTNPTFNIYNIQGQLVELRTYKNQTAEPTASTAGYEKTNWNYELATGLLLNKRYADNKGPDYSYTPDGKLLTKTSAREVSAGTRLKATYDYNSAGQLTAITYNDGSTPNVSLSYNRLGQKTAVSNGVATTDYTYTAATLALDTETITYDIDTNGTPELVRTLDRSQDSLGRSTGFQLKTENVTLETATSYNYSPTNGRLATVTDGSNSFDYNYVANSNLIATVTGPAHTVTNTYDPDRSGGILLTKANTRNIDQSAISSVNYIVNTLGQRSKRTTNDAATSVVTDWTYDALGQVETEDQPGTTTDRAYQYDHIGNRKKSANSLSLPATDNYTANALNQYTSITSDHLTSSPDYDFDGNMTHGPHPADPTIPALFFYDAENRLLEIRNATTGVTLQSNHYDAFHRLIRVTALHNGQSTTEHILWKGWTLLSRFVSNGSSLSETFHYTWGKDLSGSEQGAGGVGGLLSITRVPATGNASIRYPLYDGNGNITALVTTYGTLSATYQYDAFGNTLNATDNDASGWVNHNIHGFSTKPTFGHQGLHYYGYRWSNAHQGRWLNRDPIEERGGLNLYGFVENDGLSKFDYLGFVSRMKEVDDVRHIIVERCEAVLFIGHGSKSNRIIWHLESKCSIGGAITCWPEANNPPSYHENDQESQGWPDQQWPGVPLHDAPIFGPGDVKNMDNERLINASYLDDNIDPGDPKAEADVNIAVSNALTQMTEITNRLKAKPCCCKTVRITIFVDNDKLTNSMLEDAVSPFGLDDNDSYVYEF